VAARALDAIRLAEHATDVRQPVIAERFKTRRCRNFEERGVCPYGLRCMFAHGTHELRSVEMNMADGLVTDDALRAHVRNLLAAAATAGVRPGDLPPPPPPMPGQHQHQHHPGGGAGGQPLDLCTGGSAMPYSGSFHSNAGAPGGACAAGGGATISGGTSPSLFAHRPPSPASSFGAMSNSGAALLTLTALPPSPSPGLTSAASHSPGLSASGTATTSELQKLQQLHAQLLSQQEQLRAQVAQLQQQQQIQQQQQQIQQLQQQAAQHQQQQHQQQQQQQQQQHYAAVSPHQRVPPQPQFPLQQPLPQAPPPSYLHTAPPPPPLPPTPQFAAAADSNGNNAAAALTAQAAQLVQQLQAQQAQLAATLAGLAGGAGTQSPTTLAQQQQQQQQQGVSPRTQQQQQQPVAQGKFSAPLPLHAPSSFSPQQGGPSPTSQWAQNAVDAALMVTDSTDGTVSVSPASTSQRAAIITQGQASALQLQHFASSTDQLASSAAAAWDVAALGY
jgi:hypothetical protein